MLNAAFLVLSVRMKPGSSEIILILIITGIFFAKIAPEIGIFIIPGILGFVVQVLVGRKILFKTDGLELVEQDLIRTVATIFLRTSLIRAQVEKLYFAAKPLWFSFV